MSDISNDNQYKLGFKYEIFIGFSGKYSDRQGSIKDEFKQTLTQICMEEKISFSVITDYGRQPFSSKHIPKTSFRIVIIGIDEDKVTNLCEKLKKAADTDSIFVTKTQIEYACI